MLGTSAVVDTPEARTAIVAKPFGFQRWRSLLFLHWPVEIEALRALVPRPLEIDTFEGQAYVGLIPFRMFDVRPWRRLPPVPSATSFLETNLRTYVRHEGRPGVWFFSLDAASTLAVIGARLGFGLPYFRATMDEQRDSNLLMYESRRLAPGPRPARLKVAARVGHPLGTARAGTLEYFLVERYSLFARHLGGTLLRGDVHHSPYPLRRAEVLELDETLLAAAGLGGGQPRPPDLYSDGVDVDIFAPQRITATEVISVAAAGAPVAI